MSTSGKELINNDKSEGNKSSEIELRPLVDVDDDDYDDDDSSYNLDHLEQTFPSAKNIKDFASSPPSSHPQHGEFGVGNSSPVQVAINIFISFVGSGMLGMPYAFKQSGWLLGIVALSVMSALNVYAMILLVQTRKKLEGEGHSNIFGYGDVGKIISGRRGENFVNICLVISQIGFATAYIIFIAANLNNIAGFPRVYVCFGCVPILAGLVQIQDMKHLSPFSLIADVANITGLCAVLFQDYTTFKDYHEPVVPYNFSNVLYVASVSLYSLEGVGLVLPLESSCTDREWFPSLLTKTILGITSLMAFFGCCGYFAFGLETQAPITLNLDGEWAMIVKLALCLALYLTFPVMLFPVNEVMEDFVLSEGPRPNRMFRASVVILSASIAYAVPDFGKFLSLVGASTCSILGLILPGYFHLQAFDRHEIKLWQICFDYFLIIFGVMFCIFGTYDAFISLVNE